MSSLCAVMFVWDESDLLDLSIDGSLNGAVESFRFRSQFGYVGDFRFDRNFELVGGIPRQSEAFAVVGDEFDSHDGGSFVVDGWIQKSRHAPGWEHSGFVKNDRQVNPCV